MRNLKKSSTDKILFGVCGGLGEFFGISSNVFRFLFFIPGGLPIYIILAIFLPEY